MILATLKLFFFSCILKMSSTSGEFSTFPYMKRDAELIFSPVKPPMKIKLLNTQTFEHLHRHLEGWLGEEIAQGEKIRKIERLVTVPGLNGPTRSWRLVHNDACVLMMMLQQKDIVLLIVIS